MSAKIPIKLRNMPISDSSLWETIARWAVGALAAVVGVFTALVRSWANDRFNRVEQRVSNQESKVDRHDDKLAEHSTLLSRLDLHIEHSKEQSERDSESIRRLHEKFDQYIANG